MDSSDDGFLGFVFTILRSLLAFCVACAPVALIASQANEGWKLEIGLFIFAFPLVVVGSFLPYAIIRAISRFGGLDSYLTAAAGGAVTGIATLHLVGTGKGNPYAVYIIDLSNWFLAALGALAGAFYYWLELKFGARSIDL